MSEADDQSPTLPSIAADVPPSGRSAEPSRLLGGRYRLAARIAAGGMASVWRANDEILARTVAVKLLHDHLAADQAFRERFRREAIAAAKLTHPNIVGLYDTGTDNGHVYLVMEFVDGATLRDVVAERGWLVAAKAAAIGEQVARALAYAHDRGLVHRDVKPANILLGSDGSVKVADFGIAKAEEAADLTRTGVVLGTAAYVAPEQILAEPLDGKADQFSLGVVLYEALTGRQPFKGSSPMTTAALRLEQDAPPLRPIRPEIPDIPEQLEQTVLRALARRREQRFPDAALFADALAPFANADQESTADLAAAASGDSATDELLPSSRSGRRQPEPTEATGELAGGGARRAARRRRPLLLRPVTLLGLLVGVVALAGIALVPRLVARGSAVFERFESAISESEAGGEAPAPIAVAALEEFDPEPGDGRENGGDLSTLTDSDAASTWRSELYSTPSFGGLKQGVGFWLDLGEVHRIEEVLTESPAPGFDVELRVADTPGRTLEEWRPVGTVDGVASQGSIRPSMPTRARYVLVWVTGDLQRQGGRYAAELSSVEVQGNRAR